MSLTQVAQQTRAMIITAGIMLVSLMVATLLWQQAIKPLLTRLNPPEVPQPSYGFGLLPPISFPENNIGNYTYQMETVGTLPSFEGYYLPVYFISNLKPSSGFFSLDRANERAASLGFILEPQLLSGTEYRWNRNNPIPATLTMDAVNRQFELDVSWETDPGFLSNTNTPTPTLAVNEIKDILKRSGYLPDDIAEGRVETTLLQYSGNQFVEAISLSETQFIQVDLFRKSLVINRQAYPIVPPDPNKGIARGLVSSARDQGKRIVSLDYKYITIDYETSETYPYITGDQAWQLFQSGFGYVAVPPSIGTNAIIRRVELAYYDPLDENQQFLQPIYVFRGDNDFVGYVPAIHPEAYQQTNTQTE